VLNILGSFSRISMVISSILVMNGQVREIRHMYQFAVPTAEDFFESQYCMITVGDVDWVCLAPDKKVWKYPLIVVKCRYVL
jgi:hypothetical protein